MIGDVLTYFVIGFVYDILITFYYIKITEKSTLGAGFMSVVVTAFSVFVMYQILLSPDAIARTIAYALGCGVGTSATIHWKKRYEQNRSRSTQRQK